MSDQPPTAQMARAAVAGLDGALPPGISSAMDLRGAVRARCDVVVIGSGAGGAVLAAGLAEAGHSVVVLEEGGAYTKADFDLQEATAYPQLYQERGTRATADMAVTILQGRSVGGSTTVNWTTCYRTPPRILAHWRATYGLELSEETLRPHFEAVERRLSITPWPEQNANRNNQTLGRGARKLGWEASPTRRNVKGCANSGYCGVGCPVDGKQAMHVTYLRDLVAAGGRVLADCRADRVALSPDGGQARGVEASVVDRATGKPTGATLTIEAKVVVASAGAIHTPALLMRSGLRDGPVGRRTFLHPVVGIGGAFAERVDGFYGAPQSMASHQFIDRGPDKIGFFMEAVPVQPMLIAFASGQFGTGLRDMMAQLPHLAVLIGLAVDGLLPGDDGGHVEVEGDPGDGGGRIRVHYPIGAALREAMAAMHEALAKVQLAAGATTAFSLHSEPVQLRSDADLPALRAAPYGALEHGIFSAHQMGGAAMGKDPARAVVTPSLRHGRVSNLFVVDGSVLPTALGVNPSQTIYGLAHHARSAVLSAAREGK